MVSQSPLNDAWLAAWQTAPREPVFFSDDPHIWRMLVAAWQRDTVEFMYLGGSTPGEFREITPKHVFTVAGSRAIYVYGFCHERAAERIFRLDRILWPDDIQFDSTGVLASISLHQDKSAPPD